MINFNVSVGSTVTSNRVEVTTLSNIFDSIKTDNELKSKIETVRQINDDRERRQKKKDLLPYFVAATFTDGIRTDDNLISSDMMILDFDHVGDRYTNLYNCIISDADTCFAFRSPSGDGIKVGYAFGQPVTSSDLYEAVYLKYKERKEIEYGVDADKATKNVSRPCFLSYDPDLYINENPTRLIVTDIQTTPKPQQPTKTIPVFNMQRVAKNHTKYAFSAVNFLRDKLSGYDDWMKCGFALASLGDEGRSYFHILSQNPSYNDPFEYIDDKFDNFLQTRTGEIELATLFEIAKRYGFVYPEIPDFVDPQLNVDNHKSFADELRDRFAFDDQRDPNKLLGYPLNKFETLAKNIDGLQPGFYILGAYANVGKTALMTNICLDLLLTNPSVKVLFLSLDDPDYSTAYRFLSILTQFPINEVKKKNSDPNKQNTLIAKRDFLLDLVESGRLIIKDLGKVNQIDQLENEIESIGVKDLVVFLDAMYNLEVEDKEGTRIENIKRAQSIKVVVDTYKIPVIASAELRKPAKEEGKNKKPTMHDLLETGKYAYNANVVWMLSPLTATQLNEDYSALVLEFAKNKLSDFKGTQNIIFTRATGTMEENNLSIVPTLPSGPLFVGLENVGELE